MEVLKEKVKFQKYPGYKDSGVEWLGEIPESWEALSNKFIFDLKKNQVGKRSDEYDLLSLTLRGIIKRDMENPEGKFPAEFDTYQEVKKGDFVFCLFDVEETPRTVGLSPFDGMITGAYTVMQPRRKFDKSFLYYFYLNLDSKKRMKPLYKGLRNTIPKDSFFSFKTFLPPKEEQTAIANFLDEKCGKIDTAITQKQKLIELLKERKQIIIQNAVTKGLDKEVVYTKTNSKWVASYPSHWTLMDLKFFSEVQSGLTLGKKYNEKLEKYSYLRVANVQLGYFELEEIAEVSIPKKEAEKYLIRKEDILVTEGGDLDKLGRGNVWNGEIKNCLHQNHIFAIRINKEVALPQYISKYFESDSARKYFTNTANKTTNLASTNKTKLGNLPVLIPPIAEQKAILLFINSKSSEIEQAIKLQQQQIEKLKEYKSSLIDAAVTGKIKIN